MKNQVDERGFAMASWRVRVVVNKSRGLPAPHGDAAFCFLTTGESVLEGAAIHLAFGKQTNLHLTGFLNRQYSAERMLKGFLSRPSGPYLIRELRAMTEAPQEETEMPRAKMK